MASSNQNNSSPKILPCNERAVVFFNGECDLPVDFFRKNSFYNDFDFFAADGGANISLKYGVIPTAVIGDLDSISAATLRKLEKICRFINFPTEKDKSDGQLTLEYLTGQGYTEIHVFAATGGRLDQTLFNLQLLDDNRHCRIITRYEEIFAIESGAVIHNRNGCRASLVPTTPRVENLNLEGFRYDLADADINYGSTLTLSNVIISENAKVSFREGGLLLVVSRKADSKAAKQPSGLRLIKGKKR
ncbi:MAG: thiamine diphosphokinase [Candidatus Riflebacteria bacterium]|nr:thiamine diphosphokinase [Candidatus Riflebacteria bacterium]